jgi:hypothetical protein
MEVIEPLQIGMSYSPQIVIARLVRATHFRFFKKRKMDHPDKPGDDDK